MENSLRLLLCLAVLLSFGGLCERKKAPLCPNGTCDHGRGEKLTNCPQDCGDLCGNHFCDLGIETASSCPRDCGCGDGRCKDLETTNNCLEDCPLGCGDGVCATWADEDISGCPSDCVANCGNGICDWEDGESWESGVCADDCLGCDDSDLECIAFGPCGDHYCECDVGENRLRCPLDCDGSEPCSHPPDRCGNGSCEAPYDETPQTCSGDCYCGNSMCDVLSEDPDSCPDDCKCGDDLCEPAPPYRETRFNCTADCVCEDGVCAGNDVNACPRDCYCGDTVCSSNENPSSCSSDCYCGDGMCMAPETHDSCARDCKCGDGVCTPTSPDQETHGNCPTDCTCGNGICESSETVQSCAEDCELDAGADAGTDAGVLTGATWARSYPIRNTSTSPDGGVPPNDSVDAKLLRPTQQGFVAIVDAPPASTASQSPLMVAFDLTGAVLLRRDYGFDPRSVVDVVGLDDGGYALLGTVNGAPGVGYSRVVRTDNTGGVVWEKRLDSPNPHTPIAIEALPAGGFVLLLRTPNAGYSEAIVIRLDASGDVVWSKSQGIAGIERHANSLRRTSDDGFLIAGALGPLGGSGDGWVTKLDAAGDMQWQRTFTGGFGISMHDVIETTDGGYLAVGEMILRRGTLTPFPVPSASGPLLVKLDATGAPVWQRTYASASPFVSSTMRAVQVGTGYVVLVNEPSSALLAVDATGAVLWEKTYAVDNTSISRLASLQAAGAGLAAAGSSANRAWLLRLDADGNVANSCAATVAADVAGISATSATLTSVTPAASTSSVTFTSSMTSLPSGFSSASSTELICGL